METEEDTKKPVCKKKCPEVKILLNNVPVTALIDTGSAVNAIAESWFYQNKEQLGHVETIKLSNTHVTGAMGHKSKIIREQILLEITIGKHVSDAVFLVVPSLSRNCILGIDLLKEQECVINLKNNVIELKHNNDEREIWVELCNVNINETHENLEQEIEDTVAEIDVLNPQQKHRLLQILKNNKSIFDDRPGRIPGYEHELKLTDETPFCQKGWPIPLAYQQQVEDEINKMLYYGVIERANSPYINPMVTIIKKDGSVRLCLDARKLNTVTIPDYECAPPINELLTNCGNIKIMSTIDLRSSFWQIPLKYESRNYTGFLYKGKTYRFTVTPFGLKTSLASLTRGLDYALEPEVKAFTLIYVDDCLCYSSDIDTHLDHLEMLLQNLLRQNITVNFKKSQLFRTQINYLGYILSTEGVSTDPEKIESIMNFPTPKSQKQLKGFLGLTNFYNRFSNKYAEATQPLLQMLKKGVKFKWSSLLEEQFKKVKELFVNTVMLRHPNPNKQYYLQTDASNIALGGQLYQYDEDNQIAVVAFTSRTFKGAEVNYNTTEKELLGIVHCLKKFRVYLLGRRFTIVTDNKALTFLHSFRITSARMTRWILGIQEYDFDIIHCKGTENIVADTLSRNPADMEHNYARIAEQQGDWEINGILIKINQDVRKQLKSIGKYQATDTKISEIIRVIQQEPKHKFQEVYKLCDEILYRKEKAAWKIYLPPCVRDSLLLELHQIYGHGGVQKTKKLFKECFTADQINHSVKDLVRKCDTCQRCKDHYHGNKGETLAIVPHHKGELVSADFYGPLIASSGRIKYILVLVDNFTKFVKLYGLQRATTKATLTRVNQYVQAYGKPKAILTDNGTQFTTVHWTEGLKALDIKSKFTAVRNPCTNLAERINRQLGNLFRVFVKGKHSSWGRYLRVVECCLNETYHDTIAMTPYEAQHGRKPERSWTQYLNKRMLPKTNIIDSDQIYVRIKTKRERLAEKTNNLNQLTQFKIGDLVMVRALRMSDALNKVVAKFCHIYEGPYQVVEKVSVSTYRLAHVDNPHVDRGKFNIRQLKKYYV